MASYTSYNKLKFSKSDIATLKWINNVCKAQRWQVALIVIINAVNAVTTVIFANFSKNIINAATEEHSFKRVMFYAMCFFALIMFQMLLSLADKSLTERCKCKLEWILKEHMLKVIMRKDYSKISKYHTGELHNRMFNDIILISDGFATILPNLVYYVVKLLFLLGLDRDFYAEASNLEMILSYTDIPKTHLPLECVFHFIIKYQALF